MCICVRERVQCDINHSWCDVTAKEFKWRMGVSNPGLYLFLFFHVCVYACVWIQCMFVWCICTCVWVYMPVCMPSGQRGLWDILSSLFLWGRASSGPCIDFLCLSRQSGKQHASVIPCLLPSGCWGYSVPGTTPGLLYLFYLLSYLSKSWYWVSKWL